MNFIKRRRRHPIDLQLTTLIDVFTILVIFLIKGTVMSANDMVLPPNMELAKSYSKEGSESAPRVVITEKEVQLSYMGSEKLPPVAVSEFKGIGGEETTPVKQLKATIENYVKTLPNALKKSGVLINVVADKRSPYSDVFNVVQSLRRSGFETFLFVALGEEVPEELRAAKGP